MRFTWTLQNTHFESSILNYRQTAFRNSDCYTFPEFLIYYLFNYLMWPPRVFLCQTIFNVLFLREKICLATFNLLKVGNALSEDSCPHSFKTWQSLYIIWNTDFLRVKAQTTSIKIYYILLGVEESFQILIFTIIHAFFSRLIFHR